MSFDWSEYLNLAQELAGQATMPTTQEAKLRSAISRAYYAAFCKARNHLRDKERLPIPHGVEAHTFVRNQFKKSPDRSRKQIGHNLHRLRIDRNKVDYRDSITGLSSMANIDLKLAERVISALSSL